MPAKNVEIKRKLLHILFGVTVVLLLKFGLIGKEHILFLAVIGIIFSLLSKKYKIPGMDWLMQNFERKSYITKFPLKGLIFYLIGILLVLYIFPQDIALASILVLAFADSIGHLFGIKFGKIPHPFVSTKFVEGWIAGFIAGFFGALIFVPWHEALAASFFAMLVEGIEIEVRAEEVDDNLIIPFVAASAIWAVRFLF
jgi:diacylglycerol kinase (CTP)